MPPQKRKASTLEEKSSSSYWPPKLKPELKPEQPLYKKNLEERITNLEELLMRQSCELGSVAHVDDHYHMLYKQVSQHIFLATYTAT